MHLPHPITYYRNWKYKNTALLIASIVIFISVAKTDIVQATIAHIGTFGYPGIFITGLFYVSTFTVVPALAVLYEFTIIHSTFTVAIIAGLGSVVGDFLIFRFIRDEVVEELKPLFEKLETSTIYSLFHTPYFFWFTPILGALIIASPFPDEIGIGILRISHIKRWQFILLSFFLNTIGMLLVLNAVRIF